MLKQLSNKHLSPYLQKSEIYTTVFEYSEVMDKDHNVPENRANLTHRNTPDATDDQNSAYVYKCANNVEKQAPSEEDIQFADYTIETRIVYNDELIYSDASSQDNPDSNNTIEKSRKMEVNSEGLDIRVDNRDMHQDCQSSQQTRQCQSKQTP
ncbi:hypothetical protein GJ496_007694 [Pomphorhynchus laevis]|nr:hypothetical protein GJ496_007694 [Pomphorhynchus laevis]